MTKKAVDDYRMTKHRRDFCVVNGEKVFDIDKGYFSVLHVSKAISEAMGCAYNVQKLYYLLRTGQMAGHKKGGQWVIKKEDALNLYNREIAEAENQYEFA